MPDNGAKFFKEFFQGFSKIPGGASKECPGSLHGLRLMQPAPFPLAHRVSLPPKG